jgi:large subunit ribosomal protein L21
MYAVIKAGGKQHRVKAGDVIEVELTRGAAGDTVEFRPILVVDDEGRARHGKEAARAVVVAKLVGEQKGEKLRVFKYRPKTGYARRQGHRQMMTLLEIEEVRLDGGRSRSTKQQGTETEGEPEKPKEKEAVQEDGG